MLIGRILLSRYKIIQMIGSGGFGDTYKAIDIALPDNPPCMVKHLFPKSSNSSIIPIAKELFEREAKTLYHLGEHNQIPRLYAHFEENGEFYLVQEFIDGHGLSEEITAGKKFNEEQTSKLLQDILEVLTFVHQQNVIHRDIKPSNIMRRKQDGRLVLIDFGAVKVLTALTLNSQGLTNITIGVGSPGYMPSEQSRGKPRLASDVYAVGIIGIQALTGLAPQQFQEDPNTGEIIWRDSVSVSNQLANVLNTMVKDHFSFRYQNASQALDALLGTQIISKPQTTNNKKNKKWIMPMLIGIIIAFFGGIVTVDKLLNKSNITYSRLEKLLKQGKWQEADMLTAELIIQIGDKNNSNRLEAQEITNFNCLEINKIDLVWQHYSQGKFGFNIQKKIYLETGNKLGEYNEETYKKFGEKIGWFHNDQWKNYQEIFNFTDLENVQLGLLPLGRGLRKKQVLTVLLSNTGQQKSQWLLQTKNCRIATKFNQLENLLQAQKWREADRKTAEIMLELSNREQEKWIDKDSMNKIACQYIITINQLWLKHSQQKFGFSVQKRIWNNINSTNNRIGKFGRSVGWLSKNGWLRTYDLKYELEEAPEGHFPSASRAGSLSSGWLGYLLLSPSLSEQSRCLDKTFEQG